MPLIIRDTGCRFRSIPAVFTGYIWIADAFPPLWFRVYTYLCEIPVFFQQHLLYFYNSVYNTIQLQQMGGIMNEMSNSRRR